MVKAWLVTSYMARVINSLIDITPQGFPMMDDPRQPKKPCFDHGAQGKFGLNEPLNFGLKNHRFQIVIPEVETVPQFFNGSPFWGIDKDHIPE
jgi:hypothetical protein